MEPGRSMHTMRCLRFAAIATAWALGGPSAAQLLPPAPALPSLPGLYRPLGDPLGIVEQADNLATGLAAARVKRLRALVRRYPRALDVDLAGRPVVRGQVLVLVPDADTLAIDKAAGFAIIGRETLSALGLDVVILAAPEGITTAEAVRRLRARDPAGRYDFDHVYEQAAQAHPTATENRPASASEPGPSLGMVDGGVAASLVAFANVRLIQRAFVASGGLASAHGTEVASVLVRDGKPGSLLVADVYGQAPAGGSAADIARALDWLAQARVGVINISLAGPPNLLLAAAVKAVIEKGILIVAAVGNDGPAAPPEYPASYPQVIAVTAVDGGGRLLPEAGRASHVDFAALGAGVQVVRPDGGRARARGTSFAAPIVSARLAILLPAPDRRRAMAAVETLGRQARRGPASLGHGVVDESGPAAR